MIFCHLSFTAAAIALDFGFSIQILRLRTGFKISNSIWFGGAESRYEIPESRPFAFAVKPSPIGGFCLVTHFILSFG